MTHIWDEDLPHAFEDAGVDITLGATTLLQGCLFRRGQVTVLNSDGVPIVVQEISALIIRGSLPELAQRAPCTVDGADYLVVNYEDEDQMTTRLHLQDAAAL